jgi:hypothetical protein
MNSFIMTREDLESITASAMVATLDFMVRKNKLTNEEVDSILNTHTTMIVVKKSLLHALAEKMFPHKEETSGKENILVKIVDIS